MGFFLTINSRQLRDGLPKVWAAPEHGQLQARGSSVTGRRGCPHGRDEARPHVEYEWALAQCVPFGPRRANGHACVHAGRALCRMMC